MRERALFRAVQERCQRMLSEGPTQEERDKAYAELFPTEAPRQALLPLKVGS
jgi:hypothetical protein